MWPGAIAGPFVALLLAFFSAVISGVVLAQGADTDDERATAGISISAASGDVGLWRVYDALPEGAQISIVEDTALGRPVFKLEGTERSNGFQTGGWSYRDGWNNAGAFLMSWRMKSDGPYLVMVLVDTRNGLRTLIYSQSNRDLLLSANGRNIRFGLGSDSDEGQWRDHARNLADDVANGEPGNRVLSVEGIRVRGSVSIEMIDLLESDTNEQPVDENSNPDPTIYSQGDAASLAAWRVYDNTPDGASIQRVDDLLSGRPAIEFSGAGARNAYLLGALNSRPPAWNNRSQRFLQWRLRTSESFIVYVRVQTRQGLRYLRYDTRSGDRLANERGTVIHHGLGSDARNGQWQTWTRDLDTDLAEAQPGNPIIAVQGFLVRGNVRIDDVRLLSSHGEQPSPDPDPDPEEENAPPVAVFTSRVIDDAEPLTVELDASGSSDDDGIVSHEWDFGDGSGGGSGELITHSYAGPGDYPVSLTVTDALGLSATTSASLTVSTPTGDTGDDTGGDTSVTPEEAARLLAQASFGATDDSIAAVQSLGLEGWIDRQLTLAGPSHLSQVKARPGASPSKTLLRHEVWWKDVVEGEDQLRQRVAFALSQIFVISDTGYTLGNSQYGITRYYDLLRENAFGRYRTLLEQVTLSPVMGIYLSMLQNGKGDMAGNTRADENFAREVLQLFSIGLHELNLDGTPKLSGGARVPAFTQAHVEDYARVFTGWNYKGTDRWNRALFTNNDLISPMEPYPGYHDMGEKRLLGNRVSAAGLSAREDLKVALDSIAEHRNVGPFIGKQLIQRLVTSNPTPAYVRRVASVFNDNGEGARGDLGAVVKAILLDPEARNGHRTIAEFGKLREPVLRISHVWRAFDVVPGTDSTDGTYVTNSPHVRDLNQLTGESVLRSPSVFNFYRPDFAPVGPLFANNTMAPEAEIYTENYILTTTTRLNEHVQRHHDLANDNDRRNSYLDLSDERALADEPDALLDRLDLLLLSGGMSDELRAILRRHVDSLGVTEAALSTRVRDAISLILSSPDYLVQQ